MAPNTVEWSNFSMMGIPSWDGYRYWNWTGGRKSGDVLLYYWTIIEFSSNEIQRSCLCYLFQEKSWQVTKSTLFLTHFYKFLTSYPFPAPAFHSSPSVYAFTYPIAVSVPTFPRMLFYMNVTQFFISVLWNSAKTSNSQIHILQSAWIYMLTLPSVL